MPVEARLSVVASLTCKLISGTLEQPSEPLTREESETALQLVFSAYGMHLRDAISAQAAASSMARE